MSWELVEVPWDFFCVLSDQKLRSYTENREGVGGVRLGAVREGVSVERGRSREVCSHYAALTVSLKLELLNLN